MRKSLAWGIGAVVLAGAALHVFNDPFRGRATRINSLIPLSADAREALDGLRQQSFGVLPRAVTDELDARMRQRALQCSRDVPISPLTSKREIVRLLGGSACLADADRAIGDWLGLQSVGLVLAAPPISAIPMEMAQTFSDAAASIQSVATASNAGVILLASSKDIELLDLQSGKVLFAGASPGSALPGGLSPNGRIYTLAGGGALEFHSALSGNLLASLHGCASADDCGFHWLDDRSALFVPAAGRKTLLIDFKTGREYPFDDNPEPVRASVELPSAPGEFVAFSNSTVTHFKLAYDDDRPAVQPLGVKACKFDLDAHDAGGLTADGRYFVLQSAGTLYLTATDTLDARAIALEPFLVQRVLPTDDPDKIIVSGYSRNGPTTAAHYLYSISKQTLAPIGPGLPPDGRYVYLPWVNRLAQMSGAGLSQVNALPLRNPIDLHTFVAIASGQSSAGQLDSLGQAPAVPPSSDSVADYAPAGRHVLELAQDAEVQGIGVHEADNAATEGRRVVQSTYQYLGMIGSSIMSYRRHFSTTVTQVPVVQPLGTVHVWVKTTARPLVLVLSSYETVHWALQLEAGARVKAVLLSGSRGSDVVGAGAARIAYLGPAAAYQLYTPEYRRLQGAVYDWTAKPIMLFQTGYKGANFTVGAS